MNKLWITSGALAVVAAAQVTFAGSTRQWTGSVMLGGSVQPVAIVMGRTLPELKITIGSEAFRMTDRAGETFTGERILKENDVIVAKKIVEITLDPVTLARAKADPNGFATGMRLSNVAEFHCGETDNAIVIVGDDLNPPYAASGNCGRLDPMN